MLRRPADGLSIRRINAASLTKKECGARGEPRTRTSQTKQLIFQLFVVYRGLYLYQSNFPLYLDTLSKTIAPKKYAP